jgi:hypothetical protein
VTVVSMDRNWMSRLARRRGASAFTFRGIVYCDHPTERLLAHEAVHARDQERWGVLFYAVYALLPVPWLGFGRAWLEWRAYRAELQLGRDPESVVEALSAPLYLWMIPRPVARWVVARRGRGQAFAPAPRGSATPSGPNR